MTDRRFGQKSSPGLDAFADLLSQHDASAGWPGGHAADCGLRLGKTAAYGKAMLQRLRKRMGPQAI